jgi:uncharacterized membrane protein YphA (DoxX/SURF4 family)
MIAIGVVGLVSGRVASIWQPMPATLPGREILIYVTAVVLLASGVGLLVKRAAAPAALLLLLALIVWTALFKFPSIIRAPLVEGPYQSNGENAVLIAGAWILYGWSADSRKTIISRFFAGAGGLRIAYLLYGLALVAFGLSHFFYLNLTAPLVPPWLPPGPVFWAYFTGSVYVATGIAVISGLAARAGAGIAAVEITLITFFVWGPMVLAGHMTAFNQQETILSWALTAASWVLAASFVGQPWLGRQASSAPLQRATALRDSI